MARFALLLFLASPSWAAPSFTKETGVRLSSAVLQGANGTVYPIRTYYIRGSSQVYSATTADGTAFVEEAGVRLSSLTVPSLDIAISSITGLSLLPLNAGGFRMLYSVIGSTGDFRIYSATSANGLDWANDTGTAVNLGATFAQYPSLVKLNSGDWRMYYIQNSIAGNQAANHQVFTALSSNEGRNFAAGAAAVAQRAGEVGATLLTNNRVRLYYTAPVVAQTTNTTILSALSTNANGNAFVLDAGVRLSTPAPDGVSFPFVVRSTEAAPSYSWRMYYNYTPAGLSTAGVFSAQTHVPDPQALAPSTVLSNAAPSPSTILGDIFSPLPGLTAVLRRAGQADIVGAAPARPDDQTITATFNTQGQNVGFWDLVVTNANGQSATLANALNIDFPGGSVTLTDNLMRPRLGTRTQINVTIFNGGRLTIKLYTLTGELLQTLIDTDIPAGSSTFFWDGKTTRGSTVASGVYVLQTIGPKLNNVNKIVVIK